MEACVQVKPLAPGDRDGYEAVVKLGDRFSDRLGQLPYAAFDEAVEGSRLLVAVEGQTEVLLGYALYRVPRNEVSLTHLCVEPDSRGSGIARALIDEISNRHKDRLGIRAKCRDDYDLHETWTSLGFQARAKTTGRGRDQASMTVWWKDHGHPDLFSEYEQPVELRAAIDLNIVRDLAKPELRKRRSQYLLADYLAGRLQLVVSSGMLAELNQTPNERRQPLVDAIDAYPVVHADPIKARSLHDKILEVVRLKCAAYPRTEQDRNDLLQVAHAAAAGLSVFLTWDEALIQLVGPVVEDLASLNIMTPSYVVVHLEELANAEAFRQEALAGSNIRHARAGTQLKRELASFLAKSSGERRRELEGRVEQLLQVGREPRLVHSEEGTAIGLYCAYKSGPRWHVPLLRLADHHMADTLARHLLWVFRQEARHAGAILVDITEPHLSRRLVQAADFESMTHVDGHWYAPIIDVCSSSVEVAAAANNAFSEAGLGAPPLLSPTLTKHATARLEHAWWPAKVMDSDLPCFGVPIKSSYAHELFGYPSGLVPRNNQLSLGREHVYYHSVRNSRLTAPARVLWLATDKGPGTGHFFAASVLDGLLTDTPEKLYSALSYYGVFDLDSVKRAALGRPTAEALRVSDTEIFRRPVSMRRYRKHRDVHEKGPRAFLSSQSLPPELFAAIYHEGTRA
jgi:GNAT superfamily N-acetyltransferase